MRIVAGRHRGRPLKGPTDDLARPTSDRARQALFNILKSQDALYEDCKVLDAFAGTGALGLEALSQGASAATFMEKAPAALAVIQTNVETLGETANATILKVDATHPPNATSPVDLAFLDPPYGANLALPALTALAKAGWFRPSATIVVEVARAETLEAPTGFIPLDERVYGAAKLIFLRFGG